MPIPAFDRYGLLPPGVHDCSLTEIASRFGTNRHRQRLISLFSDFHAAELRPQFEEPVYVDGSFVTDKEIPNDVDVTLDLSRTSEESTRVRGVLLMLRQRHLMERYSVHFWVSLSGYNDFTAFFKYAGPELAYRGLTNKHKKGILRLYDG